MSAFKPRSPTGGADPRNGVLAQVQRYLDTLGSWASYRDLKQPEELPQRLADITAAFFGVSGLEHGLPQVTGLLGAMMALHALEQVTGSLTTLGLRLAVRGEIFDRYRGVALRRSPLTPRAARALRWLLGSRLLEADGLYFFLAGRTWHSQTVSLALWDTQRTLTHLRSLSLPYRAYYFDRPVNPARLVELVKGERRAEALPGFIGSLNELESITTLGPIKRAFFAAAWLLIEPEERDDGGLAAFDDRGFNPGQPPAGSGFGRPLSPSPFTGSGGYRPGGVSGSSSSWPSAVAGRLATPATVVASASNGTGNTPPPAAEPPPADPYRRIEARYTAPDGRRYPLLIRGLITHPITLTKKADAIYYDPATRRWQPVADEAARLALAREVEAGRLKVTADWRQLL